MNVAEQQYGQVQRLALPERRERGRVTSVSAVSGLIRPVGPLFQALIIVCALITKIATINLFHTRHAEEIRLVDMLICLSLRGGKISFRALTKACEQAEFTITSSSIVNRNQRYVT